MRFPAAFCYLCAATSSSLLAQPVSTDLSVSATRTGAQITQTETPIVRLQVANLGPSAAPSVVASADFYDVAVGRSLAAVIEVLPGCAAVVEPERMSGAFLVTTVRWPVGGMAAGELRTCEVRIRAIPTAARSGVQFFGRVGDLGVVDVASGNNTVALLFGLSPVTYVRDLHLSIVSPAGLFPAGSVGLVDLALRNVGPANDPDGLDEITVSDSYLVTLGDDLRGARFALSATADADCTVTAVDIDGLANQRLLQVDFRATAAGAIRTCTLGVVALPGAVGQSVLRFTALGNHPGEVDPVPANNSAFMRLQHTADSIPSLSPVGLALFALTILAAAIVVIERGRWAASA